MMTYKTIYNTDLKLSSITFGAWAIGGWSWGGSDKNDAIKALHKAIDIGITTLDTAPVYGFGQSEELIGNVIKGKRKNLQILTKYGLKWDGEAKGEFYFNTTSNSGKALDVYRHASKESIIKECEKSLQLLGTDYIDLYQIHWSDPFTPIEETMDAMTTLHKQGKIRYAGVCNYSLDQVKEALKHFPIASIQNPYSMLRRDIEEELVPFCIKNEIGILPYSPLQRGILSGKIKPGHKFNEGDSRPNTIYYKEPNLSAITAFVEKTIKPIAEKHRAAVGQIVISWTLMQPGISTALVGARNPEQVIENARSAEILLSEEDITTIGTELDKLKISAV